MVVMERNSWNGRVGSLLWCNFGDESAGAWTWKLSAVVVATAAAAACHKAAYYWHSS